jgi:hypothetical protein
MVPESTVAAAVVYGLVVTATVPLVAIVIEPGLPESAQAVSTGTLMEVVMVVQVGAGDGQVANAGPDINAAVAAVSINARLFKANPSLLLDRHWTGGSGSRMARPPRQAAGTPQSDRERRHLSQFRQPDASRKLPSRFNFSLFNRLLARLRHDER